MFTQIVYFQGFTTAFIVTNIEPFREVSLDSTKFPDYGEFRSFALGGMLAVIVALPDSSLMLGLLRVRYCSSYLLIIP